MKMDSVNSRMLQVFVFIGILFAALALTMTGFELWGKSEVMNSSYNRRITDEEASTLRGSIVDRQGTVLAFSEGEQGERKRIYPFGNMYAHVIGYSTKNYGKSLLEAKYNEVLLGGGTPELIERVEGLLTKDGKTGSTLALTLDNRLQEKARTLLGDSKGAIVAIDPKTGAILALASSPDFDPNEGVMEEQWGTLVENDDSPLLPRSVMGLYPPGSTFKVVTAAAAIENGLADFTCDDQGVVNVDGKDIRNYGSKAYGELDMEGAIRISSNVYFAQLAERLGAEAIIHRAEQAGFGSEIPFDLPVAPSRVGGSAMGRTELAATAMGQGKLMVTPLQMALVSAGIANDGIIMKPYLVKGVADSGGKNIFSNQPQKLYTFCKPETAAMLNEMMQAVVAEGTGKKAAVKGVQVAGKTGTAQNEKSAQGDGFDHAWFIGFAPAENPEIAVAVILENKGSGGGQSAAPLAGKLIKAWLSLE